jgi:uncharacterized repeat protein (TIGR03806 family)
MSAMRAISLGALLTAFALGSSLSEGMDAPKSLLSEYNFFEGHLADLRPATQVFPYEVNAPLFSDYAEKTRFIFLPAGTAMTYRADAPFDFPDGAVIIKNFYYPHDEAHPEKGCNILETRLLLKDAKGWKALEYRWDPDQKEARLEVAGATVPMQWVRKNGRVQHLDYTLPNLNQCKGCHSYDGKFVPIGTTARQLNRVADGQNQISLWAERGVLALPADFDLAAAPKLADYRTETADPTATNKYEAAARAYLDGNCAHCHNAHGPASTSGMFLGAEETSPERIGIGKPPVAAGRGSGNRRFGIVPGKPNESILVYRMEQDDPGIRMPELGRQLMHEEGVELIRQWIKSL